MEKLTNQEEVIMQQIWKLKECVIKDIVNSLEEAQPYTTVASIVRNLDKKDYLKSKKYANVYVYSPKIKEEDYKKTFLSGVVKDYFANSYKELVSFFAKEQKISAEELSEIIDLIEKKK